MKNSPTAFLGRGIEKLNAFLENRDQRQKNMIVGAIFVLVLLADFYLLVRPVIGVFTTTMPQLHAQKQKLKDLEDDMKNRDGIARQWTQSKEKLAALEKQFMAKSEIPSLLENLSKLAQSSQVRIITLKPQDTSDAGSGFVRIPIRLSATAAAHDLGSFLAQLEGGDVFFKVTDLKISANGADERRHLIEMAIETYAKNK